MKQIILLLCICATLLFSCKKDKKVAPDEKLYPVNFNLSGFTETQDSLNKIRTAALAAQATNDPLPVQSLVYLLFKNTGVLVSQKRAEVGSAGFGTFSDNLPAGDYTVAFIGGSSDLNVYPGPYFGYGTPTGIWADLFYKKVPITVTTGGVNLNAELNRLNAKLNIVLKDPIPTGVTKITVGFNDTTFISAHTIKGDGTSRARLITTNIGATDIGKTNYTITIYTLNNIKPFDVTINYYGSNNTAPLGTRLVKDVICKRNTLTTLSGNLFMPGNSAFNITVNQDWNTVNLGF
jgi:hypothetical protein